MNIAITDGNYKHSLGIIRSLGKSGIRPYVLTEYSKTLCSYSKYCKSEIIINNDNILKKLEEYNIELIIIVGSDSFKQYISIKDELGSIGVNIISVDFKKLELALSKRDTYLFAEKVGVPCPKTYYPQKIDDIFSAMDFLSFPVVIKGLYEVGGNIVDYAYNSNDLEVKYIKICKKYNLTENSELPMIQEYISGNGCAFFAVYDNGSCGLTFQHRRIRELPASGGFSVCAESYDNVLIQKYGKMLLDSLEWNGIAMVEFKLNKDNIPILMEINPKFWGSLDLALEAGVNFPQALIDIHLKKKIPYTKVYKYPLKYHWPLNGDFSHAIGNPSAIISILADTLNPNVKSNIWLSDFKPTFNMLIVFITGLLKTIEKKLK